jgi:hypothetical protein
MDTRTNKIYVSVSSIFSFKYIFGRHDVHHNDTQHINIQHNDIQHIDIQNNNK